MCAGRDPCPLPVQYERAWSGRDTGDMAADTTQLNSLRRFVHWDAMLEPATVIVTSKTCTGSSLPRRSFRVVERRCFIRMTNLLFGLNVAPSLFLVRSLYRRRPIDSATQKYDASFGAMPACAGVAIERMTINMSGRLIMIQPSRLSSRQTHNHAAICCSSLRTAGRRPRRLRPAPSRPSTPQL